MYLLTYLLTYLLSYLLTYLPTYVRQVFVTCYVHTINSTTMCHASGCNCFSRAMKCQPVVHACFTAVSWLVVIVYRGMINDVTLWSVVIC